MNNFCVYQVGAPARQRIRSRRAASTKPFLTAIGNHEDESGYHALFGPSYYDFTIGDSLFIVLDDSNRTLRDKPRQ